jgi:hypothetical protein
VTWQRTDGEARKSFCRLVSLPKSGTSACDPETDEQCCKNAKGAAILEASNRSTYFMEMCSYNTKYKVIE